MSHRIPAALAAAALVVTTLASPQAFASAPDRTVALHPAALERGPDVRVAHLQGKTIVDGDLRIRLKARPLWLLGTSDDAYVVAVRRGRAHPQVVVRVDPDGRTTTLIANLHSSNATLSRDGSAIVKTTLSLRNRTRIEVFDARDGQRLRKRIFPGTATVLDADQDSVVLGSWAPNRTLWWNHTSNATERIVSRTGYAANIAADRFAFFTRDPYRDGCSLVSRLRKPDRVMWRSCRERVEQFSDNGSRMATVGILDDGVGPSRVNVRKGHGRLQARYTTGGWFGRLRWESNRALLLETQGRKKAATVRCVRRTCERASALSTPVDH